MTTDEKKNLILDHEKAFAFNLADAVIQKPKMSVWMILIPIIFVFHIFRHKKYVEGRNEFAENYMITRKQALEEAREAFAADRRPDTSRLVKASGLQDEMLNPYAAWVTVLTWHYQNLFRSNGDSYGDLVRSAYGDRGRYLLFLEKLNGVEKAFNTALKPHLESPADDVNDIVSNIETTSEQFRQADAERIFPQ